MKLCCCEYKDDVFRRFLQRFQQSVESGDRQHMYFVDDEYLLFNGGWRICDIISDFTYVIYAVVARCIHFNDVNDLAALNARTAWAFSARISVFRILAVQGFRQYFCAGRLARTAGAAEQVSMRQLIGLDLVPQDLRYMILPAYV